MFTHSFSNPSSYLIFLADMSVYLRDSFVFFAHLETVFQDLICNTIILIELIIKLTISLFTNTPQTTVTVFRMYINFQFFYKCDIIN